MAVKVRFTNVMTTLSQIILLNLNVNKDEREDAARLKKILECFEFVILMF